MSRSLQGNLEDFCRKTYQIYRYFVVLPTFQFVNVFLFWGSEDLSGSKKSREGVKRKIGEL